MMSGILSQTELVYFPLFAFVLFSSIFTGVLVWVCRPGARSFYENQGRMPLDENLTPSEGRHVQP